jgi:WD40 repeat protein
MSDSGPGSKDSVTEVAEESFVRERPPDIERGTVLAGRYQIEDIIGKGGSGIVLRVFDRTAQNVVALKVLKTELARDAKWEKRFSRELRLGRPIQHPNVCRIFDIGEADGHRFLTMEIAQGGSLRDELKLGGALERPMEAKMADAGAVIAGLAALHAAGVVHRDFKPDNLLRMGDGRLVLSDFGLATDAATAPGVTVLIGTPHYMAPEVLAGEPATSRSDVWALGVVLHEIFFGRRPERRSVSFDGAGKGPIRPNSSEERAMLALCERCLVESPLDRPADATEVATMFANSGPSQRGLGGRRSARRVAGYGLLLLAFAVGGGVVAKHLRRPLGPSVRSAGGTIVLPAPTQAPADWTKTARVITEIPGKVHCFSLVDGQTAQIVWGTPRRAEDVDLSTGRRRPSHLVSDAYAVDCPELSPSGSALLFTALTPAGSKEIRLSQSRDGGGATTVTSGSEAMWLGGNDEFLYTVDPSHAAVFSLPTMTFNLLPEPKAEGHRLIADKAVGKDGRALALLLYGDDSTFVLAVYSGRGFTNQKAFFAPGLRSVQFGQHDDEIVLSYSPAGSSSTLAEIDWREGTLVNLGRYAGFGLVAARFSDERELLLARRISSDGWMVQGTQRLRLTSDGQTSSVARSSSGDLLLARNGGDGSINIWWQGRDGVLKKLTHGTADVAPDFSPDGRSWVYSDYAQKSIVLCSIGNGTCGPLRHDELLPTWPRFSPDGEKLAYLTQVGSTQLTIISARDGHTLASWDACYQCEPVWSSPMTVWGLEISSGHRVWFERNVATGKKTGNRFEAPTEGAGTDASQCWPKKLPSDTPFAQPVHAEAEQTSLILGLR